MTLKQKNEIEIILNALNDYDFSDFGSETKNDLIDYFRDHYKGQLSWSHDTGASKFVFVFSDFVIKIPFRYSWAEEELMGANSYNGEYWDYCAAELEQYEFAVKNGVEEFFAAVEYLGDIDGHPIYFQEFADIYCMRGSDSSEAEVEEFEESEESRQSAWLDLDSYWRCDVLKYYGKDKYKKFMNYIADADIEDLHDGNIGYIHSRPVLIDFSGWNN